MVFSNYTSRFMVFSNYTSMFMVCVDAGFAWVKMIMRRGTPQLRKLLGQESHKDNLFLKLSKMGRAIKTFDLI